MAFFEEIGKRLTDAGQNVAQQTKNISEINQLNNSITEKEKRIAQLLMQLGKVYYEKHRKEANADDLEKMKEISKLYTEVIQYRDKIKQIKGISKCEKCGADVPLEAAFCNQCGTKVTRTEPVKKSNENRCICPVCHASIENDNMFCTQCGAKLG